MNEIHVMQKKFEAFSKNGHFEYTNHENMFASLFPELERQVNFGTGPGGLEKWGSKKFTADFFDSSNSSIIEIDGDSHKREYEMIKDELRKRFFESIGIDTIRISNSTIERLFLKETKRGADIFAKITDES